MTPAGFTLRPFSSKLLIWSKATAIIFKWLNRTCIPFVFVCVQFVLMHRDEKWSKPTFYKQKDLMLNRNIKNNQQIYHMLASFTIFFHPAAGNAHLESWLLPPAGSLTGAAFFVQSSMVGSQNAFTKKKKKHFTVTFQPMCAQICEIWKCLSLCQ